MPKHLTLASVGDPDLPSTSESEEMYLITLARAVESGQPEPVPMPVIAQALSVSVASANEMVRKLATRDLVSYTPYHGASLTDSGRTIANRVLRTRRVWATFLTDQLGFSPTEADDQACELEHATSPEAVKRLAAFLGDPKTGPLGNPIPAPGSSQADRKETTALDGIAVGTDAEVVAITATDAALQFLSNEGISVGARIAVIASGDLSVLVDAGKQVSLTRELASTIGVREVVGADGR